MAGEIDVSADYPFQYPLSLKKFSAVSVASCLWSYHCRQIDASTVPSFTISNLSLKIIESTKFLGLPIDVRAYLVDILNGMQEHAKNIFIIYPNSFRNHMVWFNNGTIDNVSTFSSALEHGDLESDDRDYFAPRYCLNDPDKGIELIKDHNVIFQDYWRMILLNEPLERRQKCAVYSEMYHCAIQDNCLPAVKFFWEKLRNEGITHTLSGLDTALSARHNRTIDISLIVQFLLSKMKNDELMIVFNDWSIELTSKFATDWPLTTLFNSIGRYIPYVREVDFVNLVNTLALIARLMPSTSTMLTLVWKSATVQLKRTILSREGAEFIGYLIMSGATGIVKNIVDDGALGGDGRQKLIIDNISFFWDLIDNNKHAILKDTVKILYPDPDKRLCFMSTIMDLDELEEQIITNIKEGRTEMAFALLDLLLFSEKEARNFVESYSYADYTDSE